MQTMSDIRRMIAGLGVFAAAGGLAAQERGPQPAGPLAIAKIEQTPWIVKRGNALMTQTVLTLANAGGARDAWARIAPAGKAAVVEPLGTVAAGSGSKTVHVPELEKDGDRVTFELFDNAGCAGAPLASRAEPQKKIRRWLLFINQDMHQDIGFTHYQEDLKRTIWPGYLDVALKAMSDSDGWDEASKVRLGAESSFQFYDSALPSRNADWVETLKTRIAERRLNWGAGYGDVAQENMSAEELARSCYYSLRHLPDMLGGGGSPVAVMADNNSLCWSAVDAFREAGIRHYTLQLWGGESRWSAPARLFYVEGNRSGNRLLVCNAGDYTKDPFSMRKGTAESVRDAVGRTLMSLQGDPKYPYDAFLCQFSNGDNGRVDPTVYERVRGFNAFGYAYPKMRCALPEDFYRHIESQFADAVPVVRGNFENWWNYGVGSTAYETAAYKANQDRLAAAEILATLAVVLGAPGRYPYEDLADAWRNMVLYAEHTWGANGSAVDKQWCWKRNTALAAEALAGKVLRESLAAVSSRIPAAGKTVVVYNLLPWPRSDLARVPLADLPEHFDLVDNETSKPVIYERLGKAEAVFVAADVPALGYKTFGVTPRADEPKHPAGVTAAQGVLENRFFKISFDAAGAIASILDKIRGNAELVDKEAPYKMNEFLYCRGKTEHRVESAKLSAAVGPVMGTLIADGSCPGVESLKRSVVLYDAIPRIDFIQDVVKSPSGFGITKDCAEEGYFVFPVKVPNFLLRHEMPAGNVRPLVDPNPGPPEQLPTTCTDHFTVNRWVDVSNQADFGVTLVPADVPLVMYGKRTPRHFNVAYKAAKPWIYSYAFNSLWCTNFQKTQPGRVVFHYSLRPHGGADWLSGGAHRFGAEVCGPLKTCVVAGRQAGRPGFQAAQGQFIAVSPPNVVLTIVKLAEANGQGIILRFNELEGRKTEVTVDLGLLAPASAVRTDLVENDRGPLAVNGGKVTFGIDGYSWSTIRVLGGQAPPAVAGVSAVTTAGGTQVTWADQPDASQFEVFRGAAPDFKPGAGAYLVTVSANHFYDRQVRSGLTGQYYYRVRAVRAGAKGPFSEAAKAAAGALADAAPPSAPRVSARALRYDKIDLRWEPAADNVAVKAYEVHRDDAKIADLEPLFLSWIDFDTVPDKDYRYTVIALDEAGNRSAAGDACKVSTRGFVVPDPQSPAYPHKKPADAGRKK
jgi:hypothetical protein